MAAAIALSPEDRTKRPRPAAYLHRAAASHVKSYVDSVPVEAAARAMFGNDGVTQVVLTRSASSPAKTTGTPGWADVLAASVVEDQIAALTSVSAAAGLISRGTKLTFDGAASIKVPGHLVDASDAGAWVAEGLPVRVRAQRMSAGPTLVPRKIMVITSYTSEMVRSSNIEAISRSLIQEAASMLLDQTMFGAQSDNGVVPAGLLNGLVALSPTTGGGMSALAGDVKNLVSALVAAGAGRDPVLIMNPVQAATLRLVASPLFNIPVLQSSALAVGTVVIVESSSFMSAFDPAPQFVAGQEMAIHYEDTAPQDITGGSPSPAVPVKSMYQVDSVGLRMTLNVSYGMRAATVAGKANIAYLTGATW